ncbi:MULTISPECIES: lipase maturation factor family protein [unclassified Streptomyces]|uniref:lipase maturation factor family protein n=1 Tax=unclassified Streptomyces TaxID=2593676 RepID=UPI0022B74312|nr:MULTISPECIES: lipase maturation factor family protein [unclassified Streptomyces]MCZ7415661.1 lipase maturation factor family protein [Streptomyces sp. WMMC897]MCZ7434526.1 lipase maturation factor family protein [Streptomyces sp. WMMC1477]
MEWLTAPEYWTARLVFQRGLAAVYLIAFASAALQFRALIGTSGMTPVPAYLRRVPFRAAPSLFHWRYSDRLFAAVAWTGAALAAALLAGLGDLVPLWVTIPLWLLPWALYLSIVNVGQTWYAFGWESLLLEAGFLAAFLGNDEVAPPLLTLLLLRWLLFRVEFGAGLIKWRGDRCWRDLTCLYYHHETQPMPGPLSWFFHHLPRPVHRVETAANHVAQLGLPVLLFAPQPIATWAAAGIVLTQLWLVVSGNFAWLNWLTILLAVTAVNASGLFSTPAHGETPGWFTATTLAVTALVAVLSYWPVRNLVSSRQEMNRSFNAYHLVNTYGAFGTVTRLRHEVVIEGTDADRLTEATVWREYGFRGKPGDARRLPRQYAPWHLRLDWLMWFAALSPGYARPWFTKLLERLLAGDPATLRLLRHNPFPDAPPTHVRARLYRYRFTTARERRATGAWWHRELVGPYAPALSRR